MSHNYARRTTHHTVRNGLCNFHRLCSGYLGNVPPLWSRWKSNRGLIVLSPVSLSCYRSSHAGYSHVDRVFVVPRVSCSRHDLDPPNERNGDIFTWLLRKCLGGAKMFCINAQFARNRNNDAFRKWNRDTRRSRKLFHTYRFLLERHSTMNNMKAKYLWSFVRYP